MTNTSAAMQKPVFFDDMFVLATNAMKNSYAPYSKFHVGCCIRTAGNKLFSGTNVENAAYACAQCAEASAMGAMVTQGELKITEVLLISSGDAACPPCGNCRQKLWEFASPSAFVYLCNKGGLLQVVTLGELLPYSFDVTNLSL